MRQDRLKAIAPLGWVSGTIYAGRTAGAGFGAAIDLDGNGTPDATFSRPCGFLLELKDGRVTAAEAGRQVTAGIQGRKIKLERCVPALLAASGGSETRSGKR